MNLVCHRGEIKVPLEEGKHCDERHRNHLGDAYASSGVSNLLIKNAEITMSLLHRTDVHQRPNEKADRKHPEYSLILALLCAALAFVVASAIFTPVTIGSGISSEASLVGP